MKTCVILNPKAGSAGDMHELETALGRLGEVQLRTTDAPGSARRLAHDALDGGAELVVAAGGDGTINEVVNGLAQDFSQAWLGIIPLGTGNDFARSIQLPTDLPAAIETLMAAQTRLVDVVRVTSDAVRYFINVSAGGFSGVLDEKVTDELKRAWGPLAYLRAGAEALPDLTAYRATLTFDDVDERALEVYNVVVANGRYVAGGIPVAPQAELDDGLLDIMLAPAAPVPRLLIETLQILVGRHLDSDLLIFRRARKVRITADPGMWFNVDGELVGNQPATFEVLPRVLRVIVGRENDHE